MFLKLKGAQVSIATANNVGNATVVRIVNTGTAAVVNLAYANGTVYANTTVLGSEAVVVAKGPTDTLTGANMVAAPVDFRG